MVDEALLKEVFEQFKEVFSEFKDKLERLIDMHDLMIQNQETRIGKLEERSHRSEVSYWKALLVSALSGAGSVKGIEHLLDLLK